MITQLSAPDGHFTCFVCHRIILPTARDYVTVYPHDEHQTIEVACRPCAARFRREGLAAIWNGETIVNIGPAPSRAPN